MPNAPTTRDDASPIEIAPTDIVIVLGQLFSLLSLAVCTEFLRIANREHGGTLFRRRIITADGAPVVSSSGIEIRADAGVADIGFAPVVVVLTSYDPEAACTPGLLGWLRWQDRRGAILACADTGALVLARAGVLRDRHVAVHHEATPAYRETLGEAILLDRVHAVDGDLLSSGGGMATADMMLQLIQRLAGRALAARVAHVLNYRQLPAQAPPSGVGGDSAVVRIDRRLGRMVELMQARIESPLPLAAICRLTKVDSSTARRLFKRRFGTTPNRYYMGLRLERARQLLGHGALAVGQIATLVGFSDASAFARAYRRRFGALPSVERRAPTGS